MADRPRVAVIAQARMGSSRLPGKVLRRVGGESLLGHLVARLGRARTVDRVVLATTTAPQDEAVVEEARRLGVEAFQGDEHDVLGRYLGAAALVDAEVIVRVTGDCPLLDPAELDRVVEVYLGLLGTEGERDFVRNQAGEARLIPRGHDVEVFSRGALERAALEADLPGDREHVTPYFYRTSGIFRTLVTDPPGPDRSHLRLTVDTPEDLALVEAVVDALGPWAEAADIDKFLNNNKHIASLNAGVIQRGIDSERQRRAQRVEGRALIARADAHPGVGFGHVARLGALLDAWAELGGRAILHGAGVTGAIRDRLLAAGVEVVDRMLGRPPQAGLAPEQVALAGAEEAEDTLALARDRGAVALACDGYGFKAAYQRALGASLPLLAVDDLADFPSVADVVLNQNMGFDAGRYGVESKGRLLVGHPYVLLRREFRAVTEALDAAGSGGVGGAGVRVLITFGGSDPARLTAPVAAALAPALGEADEVVVIAGGGMAPQDRAALDALAARSPGSGARVTVLSDVREMSAVIAGAAAAVTAAGSTTWELLACGVPPLAVPVAENQRAVATGVASFGAGVDLGWHEGLEAAAVRDAALALIGDEGRRAGLVKAGRALIDGRGVWRAIDALLDAIEAREAGR